MSHFDSFLNEKVEIFDPSGTLKGTYRCMFGNDGVEIHDKKVEVDEGDEVRRKLPNGRTLIYRVRSVDFRPEFHSIPAAYKLKLEGAGEMAAKPSPVQQINIHNSQGIQVGNENKQDIVLSLEALIQSIEAAEGSAEQKSEAKGFLEKFLRHPITKAALDVGADVILKKLAPRS